MAQEDFPDSWDNDCDTKNTRVEISEFTFSGETLQTTGFDWIEIPTSHVETWSSKDNNVSIKRTSKIQFPTEWDGGNVRNVVKGFGNSGLRFGRVSHKNDEGDYVVKHVGYIGGVGGGSNPIESKAWIYDFSELLKAVPVNESVHDPTIFDIGRIVADNIVNETTVPLTDVVVVPPETEEELAVVYSSPLEFINTDKTFYTFTPEADISGTLIDDVAEFQVTNISEPRVEVGVEDYSNLISKFLANEFGIGIKKFRENRDTLYDFLNWVRERGSVSWHFEPTENGAALVFDVLPSSRTFAQEEVVSALNAEDIVAENITDEDEYRIHDTITVEDNNVLYDINPVNTILVLGDTKSSLLGGTVSLDTIRGVNKALQPNGYPVVKARADPLYQAAGNTEQQMETVESDAQTIDQAKVEARETLKKAINDSTEGKITCLGNPYIKPYDTLDAFETCGDYIEEQPLPVRYEVQSVKHEENMTGLYRTFLNVTIHVGNDEFSFPVETTKQTDGSSVLN